MDLKQSLRNVIELTAGIDPRYNTVWGYDTEIDTIDNLLIEAHKILNPFLKKEYQKRF